MFTGRIPQREMLNFDLRIDEGGYIITDDCMHTNLEGIYAAGDFRSKQVNQLLQLYRME